MYPTLETERLILKPLADDDFLDMFTLFSNPDVVDTMEGEVHSDRSKYEKEFMSMWNYYREQEPGWYPLI